MILLKLFWEFFKVGLFTVGGGMASLPFLYDISERTGWYTASQLADMLAVSESTPGPIGINMATYTGFTVSGVLGGTVATLGFILPEIIIILIISGFLEKFRSNKYVEYVFYGLRACSVGLIAAAGLLVLKISLLNIEAFQSSGLVSQLFNFRQLLLAALLIVCTRYVKPLKNLHPIFFIAFSAVIGIVFAF